MQCATGEWPSDLRGWGDEYGHLVLFRWYDFLRADVVSFSFDAPLISHSTLASLSRVVDKHDLLEAEIAQ